MTASAADICAAHDSWIAAELEALAANYWTGYFEPPQRPTPVLGYVDVDGRAPDPDIETDDRSDVALTADTRCRSPRCWASRKAGRKFCANHCEALDRVKSDLGQRKSAAETKPSGPVCRVDGCNWKPWKTGTACWRHRKAETAQPKTSTACRLEGCESPARKGTELCYRHRQIGPEVTVAPATVTRNADGSCGYGCGRPARPQRPACVACGQARRMIPTCAREGCNRASSKGPVCGYCKRR